MNAEKLSPLGGVGMSDWKYMINKKDIESLIMCC
jgi:hypothetical protein